MCLSQIQVKSNSSNFDTQDYRVVLDRYCVTCHNKTLKTAGLMLDSINLDDIRENPEVWEKVVTKLSLRAMPPVGMPRPDNSFYDHLNLT